MPASTPCGQYIVTWDGTDNNASSLNPIGLRTGGSGVDLTAGGTNSYLEIAGAAEKAGGTARVRVYTDASNFSQATMTLGVKFRRRASCCRWPRTLRRLAAAARISPTSAPIELQVDTTTMALDGQISTFRMVGSKTFTADFNNQPAADLSLAKTTSNPNVDVGQTTSFTLNLLNSGPDTATNVAVTDLLPAGLTFVSATASQGSYNSRHRHLDVGDGAGEHDRHPAGHHDGHRHHRHHQYGPDLRPPINSIRIPRPTTTMPGEDDQSSITLTPQLADLSLEQDDQQRERDPRPARDVHAEPEQRRAQHGDQRDGDRPAAAGADVRQRLAGRGVQQRRPASGPWARWPAAPAPACRSPPRWAVPRPITNTAQVSASAQRDPDSTPNNNIATEDDQASVTITPQVADLSLAKTIDNPTPNVGQNVTFTIEPEQLPDPAPRPTSR